MTPGTSEILKLEEHSARLQSMRGLAALSVAVGHCFTTLPHGRIEQPDFSLSLGNAFLAVGEILVQPNTAVIFFYVLSGLVLRESLRRRDQTPTGPRLLAFSIRRLCRMVPGMWVSIALAAVVLAYLPGPIDGATRWFNGFLERPLSPSVIVQDLIAWTYTLNPVLWSIQVELVMIPILPIMFWMSRRAGARTSLAIYGLLAVLSVLTWNPSPNALRFVHCFYLGVALPEILKDPRVRTVVSNGHVALAVLAALAFVEFLYVSNRLWLPYKFVVDTLACAQLIGYVMSKPHDAVVNVLHSRLLVWLGDISYSFYVFAGSVQIVVATILLKLFLPVGNVGATLLTLAIIALTVALSGVIAAASYRWIERPGIRIGQIMSARIERSKLSARSAPHLGVSEGVSERN
jgi:peptidoglycan/LPS O-acetylase OafA/YrhL